MKNIYFNTGKRLSRRTMLRGAGVCLALPLLDAMGQAAPTANAKRFVGVSLALGLHAPNLVPENEGEGYKPSPYLAPLQDIRDAFTVVSGTSHPGVGSGHAAVSSIFTACPNGGGLISHNTISLDQRMASVLGGETRFPSLVLSTSSESETSTSYTAGGAMIPAEQDAAALFTRLFIDDTPEQRKRNVQLIRQGHSLMDSIVVETKSLTRKLGSGDRDKLDAWLTSVRDFEQTLERDSAWIDRPKPDVDAEPPSIVPGSDINVMKAMLDVLFLALQSDSTRFATLHVPAHALVGGLQGVRQGYHDLSHHGQDPGKLRELAIIEHAVVNEWADFLRKLKGADLLGETMSLLTSNLGNGSSHNPRNMPVLFAGGGFKHGRHLAFDQQNNYALPKLYLSALAQLGIGDETFSTTSGEMDGLV